MQMTVKAKEKHRMVHVGHYPYASSGEESGLYVCSQGCGETWAVRFRPYKKVKLCRGNKTLTEEDQKKILDLCRQGPAGQAKAKVLMAASPSHVLVRVPSEDDLRFLAANSSRLEEFEAAVEKARVKGEPLLTFGMGGATAEAWPKGTGGG